MAIKAQRLTRAVAAARRESEDTELEPLVQKITAGVAKLIRAELQQNPDRTDEILSALGDKDKAMDAVLAQVGSIRIPPPEVDLAPLIDRIAQLETSLQKLLSKPTKAPSKEVEWVFEHKRDDRGRMAETIAKPRGS